MDLLIADISPFPMKRHKLPVYNQHLTILKAILSIDLSTIRSRGEAESLLIEKISSEKIRGLILKNLQRNAGDNLSWKMNALISL